MDDVESRSLSAKLPWLVAVAYTDIPSDARVLREAREAARRGFSVTLVGPRPAVAPAAGLNGVESVWLDVAQQRGRTTALGQLRFMALLYKWARAQSAMPAVVHVHNMPDYLYWAVRFWQKMGARIVLDVHDIMSDLALHRFRGILGTAISKVLGLLERAVWRRADAIITVHETYADAIRTAVADEQGKVHVVINAPDPLVCRPELRQVPANGSFKIVFHGTVSERTGVAHAVDAMPIVLRERPDARLLIIGSGNGAVVVHDRIAALGLGAEVEFVDRFLPLEEVIARIADAHAAVVPNEVSQYTAAILPVKLLEYATLGIPVVATRLPLIERYFEPGAVHLIDSPEPDLIAGGILRLARDKMFRERLGASAREFAVRHGWDHYRVVLAQALGAPSGRSDSVSLLSPDPKC